MNISHKLLAFLYYLPPMPGTAPRRNQSMLLNLSAHMKESHVYTSAPIAEEFDHTNKCSYRRVKSPDYRSVIRKMTTDGHIKDSKKENVAMQMAIKLINTFPFNLLLGEGGGLYLFNCIRRGRKTIIDKKITHIYSSYRPMTDHFAAYRLKKMFPHLTWIADCRDLPVEPHYKQQFFPRWHYFMYKRILGAADIVTTISAGYAEQLKRYHSESMAIMNGLPDDHTFPAPATTSRFTLVYTGSMFKNERNAAPVFKAIQFLHQQGSIRLEDFRIIYAGKDGREWQQLASTHQLTDVFEDRGILGKVEAQLLQSHANINLLLTMASPEVQGVMTGKFIEYLATGLPILCVVKNERDRGLEGIFAALQAGLCISDSEDFCKPMAAFIKDHYDYWCLSGQNRIVINHDALMAGFSNRGTMSPLLSFLRETS